MIAPKYITQGLKAIDSLYFAVFNPNIREAKNMSYGKGRWQIRKWVGINPKRLDLWNCYGYSEVIMTICKEAVTEGKGLIDVGYQGLDMRVIHAIGESNHWKADYKKKIADMDWRNEQKQKQAEEQLEYEARYMAKKIYQQANEPTFFLSGKSWKI